MDRHESVTNLSDWTEAIQELGKADLAVVSWQVMNEDAMAKVHEIMMSRIMRAKNRLYVRPETIPDDLARPAYEVAKFSGRIVLSDQHRVTAAPYIRGDERPVTGLHADIKDGLPAVTSLVVLRGAIDTYIKLLPLEFLGPDRPELMLELMDKHCEPSADASARNVDGEYIGYVLREEARADFTKVSSAAGTILAFPAAGSLERGIHPSAHEVHATTPLRHTLPLLDINFARYRADIPASPMIVR